MGKQIKVVANSGNIQLDQAQAALKKFGCNDSTHTEDGWHTVTRCVFDVMIEDAEQLAALDEADIIRAMQAAGVDKTLQLRIKRKMPACEFTLVAEDGGTCVFIGAFKLAPVVRCVRHNDDVQLTLRLTVDGDIMADSLPMLARMMDFPISLTTVTKQIDLFDGQQAA